MSALLVLPSPGVAPAPQHRHMARHKPRTCNLRSTAAVVCASQQRALFIHKEGCKEGGRRKEWRICKTTEGRGEEGRGRKHRRWRAKTPQEEGVVYVVENAVACNDGGRSSRAGCVFCCLLISLAEFAFMSKGRQVAGVV